jgi:mannosyltransferase
MIHLDGIVFSLQRHGGISVYTRELLRRLNAERWPTWLTLETPTAQAPAIGDAGDDASTLTIAQRPRRPLERYRRCRAVRGATVFHSSYYRLPAQRRMPSVVTVHDFTYERFARGPRRWVHLAQKHAAIRAADALICISQATQADLERWVGVSPSQRVHVIPNGVGEAFHPLPAEPLPERPRLLFVGARGGYKNFALAVRALARLPDHELHCVGGGPLQAAELAAAPAEVRRRVVHLGFVDDDALNRHYNRAECLLYPSAYEGFGIPVLEAMRAGCPVIGIEPCSAVREVGGDALVVVPADDPAALAEAVLGLADPQERAARRTSGLRVAAAYSWASTHARTLEVFRAMERAPAPEVR